MLVIVLGVVLTAIIVAKVGYRSGAHSLDFGTMSHQWLAAYNASRPSSSQ